MCRITCLTDFALALFCMLLCVPIASGQQPSATGTPQPVAGPVHFYFCASNQIGVGHTAYISNIFAVSKQNSPPIENEYLGFLKKTYSYPANQTACFDGYLTQEAVRAARQTRIEQFEQIKDKVVETPWTYSAALSDNEIHPQPPRVSPPPVPSSRVQEAAPEAASAATAAKPPVATAAGQSAPAQGRWFYCYNTVPMPPSSAAKQFVSSVFQSDGDPDSISRAWDIYIAKKYAPLNQKELLDPNTYHSPHCSAGLQGALQDLHDRAVKGSAIDVDWKYTPDQAASAATAAQPPAAAAGQSAPAQTQKQQGEGWWWYCSATNTAGRQYMTGVFFYPADIRGSYGTGEVNTAWGNYVTSKHPTENLSVACQLGGADQAATQRFHDGVRANYKGGQVVDVDWKYVPGQDTPPVGPAANYYCFAYFGQSSKNNYASSVFVAPWHLRTDIMANDFAQFVKEKYQSGESGEKVTGTCYTASINEDKAVPEAGKVYQEARWRSGKWIETGWKPTTLPPAGNMRGH